MTVYENLEYLSALDLSINSNNKLKIEEAMNYFNIYKYKDYPVKNLSEGNKKKTSLAMEQIKPNSLIILLIHYQKMMMVS